MNASQKQMYQSIEEKLLAADEAIVKANIQIETMRKRINQLAQRTAYVK